MFECWIGSGHNYRFFALLILNMGCCNEKRSSRSVALHSEWCVELHIWKRRQFEAVLWLYQRLKPYYILRSPICCQSSYIPRKQGLGMISAHIFLTALKAKHMHTNHKHSNINGLVDNPLFLFGLFFAIFISMNINKNFRLKFTFIRKITFQKYGSIIF